MLSCTKYICHYFSRFSKKLKFENMRNGLSWVSLYFKKTSLRIKTFPQLDSREKEVKMFLDCFALLLTAHFNLGMNLFPTVRPSCYILFTHAFPVMWCIFEVLFLVWSTIISKSKMHCNAETTCVNGKWNKMKMKNINWLWIISPFVILY